MGCALLITLITRPPARRYTRSGCRGAQTRQYYSLCARWSPVRRRRAAVHVYAVRYTCIRVHAVNSMGSLFSFYLCVYTHNIYVFFLLYFFLFAFFISPPSIPPSSFRDQRTARAERWRATRPRCNGQMRGVWVEGNLPLSTVGVAGQQPTASAGTHLPTLCRIGVAAVIV